MGRDGHTETGREGDRVKDKDIKLCFLNFLKIEIIDIIFYLVEIVEMI